MLAPQTSWEKPKGMKTTDIECAGTNFQDRSGTSFGTSVSPDVLPLPPNWEEFSDEDGEVYYANSKTGETSWEKPSSMMALMAKI